MDEQKAIFTNRFQLAVNGRGQEVLISFSQQQPIWDPATGEVTKILEAPACSLVMSIATAKDLVKVLSNGIAEEENKMSEQ